MTEESNVKPKRQKTNDTSIITGVILITLGILFLAEKYFDVNFSDLWPFILIVVGVLVIVRGASSR